MYLRVVLFFVLISFRKFLERFIFIHLAVISIFHLNDQEMLDFKMMSNLCIDLIVDQSGKPINVVFALSQNDLQFSLLEEIIFEIISISVRHSSSCPNYLW